MEQLEAFDGVSVDEQLDGSFRIVLAEPYTQAQCDDPFGFDWELTLEVKAESVPFNRAKFYSPGTRFSSARLERLVQCVRACQRGREHAGVGLLAARNGIPRNGPCAYRKRASDRARQRRAHTGPTGARQQSKEASSERARALGCRRAVRMLRAHLASGGRGCSGPLG